MFMLERPWRSIRCSLALFAFLLGAPVAAEEADPGWPRELEHAMGTVLIYQPQLESLEGDKLRSRAAVSVTLAEGNAGPVFGVIWSDARVLTDRDERTVRVLDVDVTDVRFPNVTDEQKALFEAFVESRIKEWDMVISLDRVLASLAALEEEQDLAEGLKTDPPAILYSDELAVLIQIDGEPRYRSIEDDALKKVINTPYTIVQDPKKKTYYLDGGIEWYKADKLLGPWTVVKKPPKKVRKLRSDAAQDAADQQRKDAGEYVAPKVIVAVEPSELIVTDGKAEYAPVEGTTALYVTNADNDILMDVDSQEHFVLFSGRWYRAKKLDGPWSSVASDALPATFSEIPADSAQSHLLAFVAGSEQAREALMDNRIPQTAAVKRGAARLDIDYAGTPEFKRIEGTQMEYAINTSYSVLKIDGRYWVCHQAVWYQGAGPEGPWEVADYRPDEISTIPPSNPHYNTKYVYVYDSTPDVVYVGYTPGYVGSYPYGGCVVYGTGWYYPSWYGAHYYPHHATWGFNVRYDPYHGWGVGVSWSNGPFTISIGGYGHGGYGYPYSYWGPRGYAYVPVPVYAGRPAYRPPANWNPGQNAPGNRPGINPPDSGSGRPNQPGGGRDNLYKRPENKDRVTDRGGAGQPGRASDRPNDVFAGRDGNVYKRGGDGGWQQRQGDGWKGVDPAQADRARERAQPSGDRTRSSASRGSGTGRSGSGLERDYGGRTRGSQRTSGYQGSRGGSRGSMGGRGRSRGGGRRR